MAKMSERMTELKTAQAAAKAEIARMKEELAQLKASLAEQKAKEAQAKADIKAEREAEKARKAEAKAQREKKKAEKAAKPKRTKKEKPQPKREEPKESPRAFEDRIAREVASELVNEYKLNNYSTLEEIKAALRKFNMANHPDVGGCPTKCKIGNMYLQAMMRKAGMKRPEFQRAA